ncbi:hypothetical protein Ahy_A10g050946 [Arachis hypogaea]|uniref:Uncharacterized protein n=1 Tax=Arachis hypogaea TaxID=3818 RepID=A0A445BB11_ARAHY|nr:hypothetical protein Ahy_A10g050946 [Arachis hypogaea]
MARIDARGCRPSATTFYPVPNILTRQKAIDHARRVVDFMSTLGVNLDLTGHNYFLVARGFIPHQNSPKDYLKSHNDARAEIGVKPLKWDPQLASHAPKAIGLDYSIGVRIVG